jgi:hypothetical protein
MMAHRESYGNYGKTSEHLAMAETSNKIYERLYRDTVDKLLTKKERKQSLSTEVWLDAEEMINRGHAISIETYNNPPRTLSLDNIFVVDDNETGDSVSFQYDEMLDKFVMINDITYKESKGHFIGVSDINQYIIGSENLELLEIQ